MVLLLTLSGADDFNTKLNGAIDALETRRPAKAEELLGELAGELASADPRQRAYFYRAQAYLALRQADPKGAAIAFEHALAAPGLKPNHLSQVKKNLLNLYVFNRDWAKAETLLNAGSLPHNWKSGELLAAHVYHQTGRMDKALAKLMRSIEGTSEHRGALTAPYEFKPVVRVAPLYPKAAAESRTEGYVIIDFRIGTAGQVVNPKIVESYPPGVFDRTALKAVRKWRYKPLVVDGEAVEAEVEPVKLDFRL